MAFAFDELFVYGGQIVASAKKIFPKGLGRGTKKICHSAYIQGNTQIGIPDAFSDATATLMVGREETKREDGSSVGTPMSLNVKGCQQIDGDSGMPNALLVSGGENEAVYVVGDMYVTGTVDCLSTGRLEARHKVADGLPAKPFDIQHPTKGEGWRLRYVSLEGPESGVYCRGRVKNQKIIKLPDYWKDLVHEDSISVQLQPIGHHQNIIVKRWDSEFIYLQGQGGGPVNCFYHVYAERKDINSLLTEYEGNSRYDYPDPNFSEKSDIPIEERNYIDPNYKFPRNTYTT